MDLRRKLVALANAADADALYDAFVAAGIEIDSFLSDEMPKHMRDEMPDEFKGQPPIRIISATGLHRFGVPNILLAVPSKTFDVSDASQLIFRLLTTEHPHGEGSCISVISGDGSCVDLFAAIGCTAEGG